MNGFLKNSFLIVSVLFLSALILHSCGDKKQEPSNLEKRLLGTWEYAGYRVNGEDWNDTAVKYQFNYPVKFWIVYDSKELDIDHRYARFILDSIGEWCLDLSYYYIGGDNIEIHGYYSNSTYNPSTQETTLKECKASKDEYNEKFPVLDSAATISWKAAFSSNALILSKTYNSNFYEWTLKK